MLTRYLSLAALLSTVACQQQQPASQMAAVPVASAAPPAVAAPAPVTTLPAPELTPEMQAFLAKYDVSALIEKEPDSHEVMNGFYGPDHYRVEFAMLSVTPDEHVAGLLHMRGKDRYKGTVTPFEGEIQLTQLIDQPKLTAAEKAEILDQGYEMDNDPTAQSVLGVFELRESPDRKGAGVIKGSVAIDLRHYDGKLWPYIQKKTSASQGGGVKFEGRWASNRTGKVQPVVWVAEIFNYGSRVFNEFTIGDREQDFNPKYARLGWNTYWQNEEWWAESGEATAQVEQGMGL